MLIPRRQYTHIWHRLLHDRTADAISQVLSVLPHSNVTIVPYHLGTHPKPGGHSERASTARRHAHGNGSRAKAAEVTHAPLPVDRMPIVDVQYRQRARVAGRVHTMRVHPHGGVGSLECTLTDETGGLLVVFLGRNEIAGEGTVGEEHGRLAMLNPLYELLSD